MRPYSTMFIECLPNILITSTITSYYFTKLGLLKLRASPVNTVHTVGRKVQLEDTDFLNLFNDLLKILLVPFVKHDHGATWLQSYLEQNDL